MLAEQVRAKQTGAQAAISAADEVTAEQPKR